MDFYWTFIVQILVLSSDLPFAGAHFWGSILLGGHGRRVRCRWFRFTRRRKSSRKAAVKSAFGCLFTIRRMFRTFSENSARIVGGDKVKLERLFHRSQYWINSDLNDRWIRQIFWKVPLKILQSQQFIGPPVGQEEIIQSIWGSLKLHGGKIVQVIKFVFDKKLRGLINYHLQSGDLVR